MSKTIDSLVIKKIERMPSTETCTCDICGRLIYKRSLQATDELPKNNSLYSFWEVTTGHNDWGNDSGDSIKKYEICSSTCLQGLIDVYKKDSSRCQRNTEFIKADHTYIFGYEP